MESTVKNCDDCFSFLGAGRRREIPESESKDTDRSQHSKQPELQIFVGFFASKIPQEQHRRAQESLHHCSGNPS